MTQTKKIKTIEDLPIDCSHLCCNFVNTVFSWKTDNPYDFLEDYDYFIDWCNKLSVSRTEYLERLRGFAKRSPAEARKVMEEIKATREILHKFLSALTKGDTNKIQKFLIDINPLLTETSNNLKLDFNGSAFISTYKMKPLQLKRPLWIITKSLYDLLVGMDTSRMKECPSCGWVFYDRTKNGKRKWCNPLTCGTQEKMSRYHQRLRQQNEDYPE